MRTVTQSLNISVSQPVGGDLDPLLKGGSATPIGRGAKLRGIQNDSWHIEGSRCQPSYFRLSADHVRYVGQNITQGETRSRPNIVDT